MIDRIEKTYAMTIPGQTQYSSKRCEVKVSASIPADAQQPTPEGKKKFLELSDKLAAIAKGIVERDIAQP